MTELVEELRQRVGEKCALQPFAEPDETVVEARHQLRVIGDHPTEIPLPLGETSGVDIIDPAHQPIAETRSETRPRDHLVEQCSRAPGDHGEVEQSLHALCQPYGILVHERDQVAVGRGHEIGDRSDPGHRVGASDLERREIRIPQHLQQEAGDLQRGEQIAVALRPSIGRDPVDGTEDHLIARVRVHAQCAYPHDPRQRPARVQVPAKHPGPKPDAIEITAAHEPDLLEHLHLSATDIVAHQRPTERRQHVREHLARVPAGIERVADARLHVGHPDLAVERHTAISSHVGHATSPSPRSRSGPARSRTDAVSLKISRTRRTLSRPDGPGSDAVTATANSLPRRQGVGHRGKRAVGRRQLLGELHRLHRGLLDNARSESPHP